MSVSVCVCMPRSDLHVAILIFSGHNCLITFLFLVYPQLDKRIANCKPLANVYDGLLNTYLCAGIIGNFVSILPSVFFILLCYQQNSTISPSIWVSFKR